MQKYVILAALIAVQFMVPSFSMSSVMDIEQDKVIPKVEQAVVAPSQEIPPTHWSYKLLEKLAYTTGLDKQEGMVVPDGEKPLNRTEMAILIADISNEIKAPEVHAQMSIREQTQFEILQEMFQSEVKILTARIEKVEGSVEGLHGKVDQLLSKDEEGKHVVKIGKTGTAQLYLKLHAWGTLGAQSTITEKNYRLRRANIGIKGKINKKWGYNVMFDPARTVGILKDLHLEYYGIPHHTIRAGQMKSGVSFDSRRSSSANYTAQRSQLGRLANIREQGVALIGKWPQVDYQIGFFNGNGENAADTNNNLGVGGYVVLRPIKALMDPNKNGKLEIGASIFEGQTGTRPAGITDNDRYGIEGRFHYKKFQLNTEYLRSEVPGDMGDSGGYYAEGVYKVNDRWYIVARYDRFNNDNSIIHNETVEHIVGVNYLVEKWNVRVGAFYMLLTDGQGGNYGNGLKFLIQQTL